MKTQSGRIYKGAYIENVAFNPSLSPLQQRSQLIVAGETYPAISTLILVEMEGASHQPESVTEAALSAIAPAGKATSSHDYGWQSDYRPPSLACNLGQLFVLLASTR